MEDVSKPGYRLYGVAALDVATFAGSILAGFLLMAKNRSATGDSDGARAMTTAAFALFVFLMGIILYVPALESIPGIVLQGVQVWAVHLYASRAQGELLTAHRQAGGKFHSKWRGLWAGLAVGVVAIGLVFAFFFLAPEQWLPPE